MGFATWNPADKDPDITLSNGNLTATGAGGNDLVRATIAKGSGKFYWEITIGTDAGNITMGVATSVHSLAILLGAQAQPAGSGMGYESSSGQKYRAGVAGASYGSAPAVGDVIGVALDLDNNAVWFSLNGSWVDGDGSDSSATVLAEIEAGTTASAAFASIAAGSYFPAATVPWPAVLTANFGASAFTHTVPTGFTSGVDNPTVANGAINLPSFGVTGSVSVPTVHGAGSIDLPTLSVSGTANVPTIHAGGTISLPLLGASGLGDQKLRARLRMPWDIRVGTRLREPWRVPVTARLRIPIHHRVNARLRMPWSIETLVQARLRVPWANTTPVQARLRMTWDLTVLNPVQTRLRMIYDLSTQAAVISTTRPSVSIAGMPLEADDVSMASGGTFWTATLEPARIEDYASIVLNDAFTITIGADVWQFIIDNKSLQRDGTNARPQITGISPGAKHASPRATRLTKTWDAPVMAHAAAEEALGGETITWNILDWQIPANRLAVKDADPIEVVRSIAKAAGALVESNRDGSLTARYRFPRRVPDWSSAAIDHTYTDNADNLSAQETLRPTRIVDKVAVRDAPANAGSISAEVDSREDGLNAGVTSFAAGETAHILAHPGPGVSVESVTGSAGTIRQGPALTYQQTEDLSFDKVSSARLRLPASSIDSVIWLGTSLGALILADDLITMNAPAAGVAIARVKYTVAAEAWEVTAPQTAGGETEFPLAVLFKGKATEERPGGGRVNIIAQRGDGAHPGPDIVDPLIGSVPVATERGRAEIEAGSGLRATRLIAIYRDGLLPGQLVEVHDALQGESWRGQVQAVQHRGTTTKLVSMLELLRA